MRGDFSRITSARAIRLGDQSVALQQGRALLDADWNEQAAISLDRDCRLGRWAIGPCGAPKGDPGFAVAAGGAGGFTVGAGTLFLDGLAIENRTPLAHGDQGLALGTPPLSDLADVADGEHAVVQVVASFRDRTVAESPDLADVALGGADTATRRQLDWHLRLTPLAELGLTADQLRAQVAAGTLVLPAAAAPTGLMAAGVADPADNAEEGDCLLPPEAGYLDTANRLYRVEIHRGGTFPPPAGEAPPAFKWTGESSTPWALTRTPAPENALVPAEDPRGPEALYAAGLRVEIVTLADDRLARPGTMTRIASAPGAPLAFDGAPAIPPMDAGPRLRTWRTDPDGDAVVAMTGDWQALEKGVRVRFRPGTYAPGTYWVVPARTATGNVLWPPYDPPDLVADGAEFVGPAGGERHACPLALVRRQGAGLVVEEDLRALFPPLTDLRAEDVGYTPPAGHLTGVETVKEALDRLARDGDGTCTVTARAGDDLSEVMARVPAGAHAEICLPVGEFALDRPLRVASRGHLLLHGAGPGTRIVIRDSLRALVFARCASVTVRDLAISAGVTGAGSVADDPRDLYGALGFEDCGPVTVERAWVTCGPGRREGSACVAARRRAEGERRHRIGAGDVTVRDCRLTVGDQQTGILVVNGATVRIADNRIATLAEDDADRAFARWTRDPAVRADLTALTLRFLAVARGVMPGGGRRPDTVRGALWREVEVDDFAGRYGARFYAPAAIAQAWENYLRRDIAPGVGANGEVGEVAQHLSRVAATIWTNAGRVRLGRDRASATSDRFRGFYREVRAASAPVLRRAIVVAGRAAEDVAITGNRIDRAMIGIHVGVSDRSGTAPGVRTPARSAGRVTVADNRVALAVAPLNADRHGVFVGNAERIRVTGNDIALETVHAADRLDGGAGRLGRAAEAAARAGFDRLHSTGIQVHGPRGRFLTVTENAVTGPVFGIAVNNPGGEGPGKLPPWLVRDNVVLDTVQPLDLPAQTLVRGRDENVLT